MNPCRSKQILFFGIGVLAFSLMAKSSIPEPIYLSMDVSMWEAWKMELENSGCLTTSDAVLGEALLIENRSYLDVKSSKLNWIGSGDFTISFWIKMPPLSAQTPWFTEADLDGPRSVFNKGSLAGSFGIGVEEGKFEFGGYPQGDLRKPLTEIVFPHRSKHKIINDNHWHLVVIMSRDGNYEFWVDDSLELVKTYQSSFDFSNLAPLRFGSESVLNMYYFTGIIDEFRVVPFARSSTEIMGYYDELRPDNYELQTIESESK